MNPTIFLLALLLPITQQLILRAKEPSYNVQFILSPVQDPEQAKSTQQLTMQKAVNLALTHRPDLKALSYAIQANKSGAKSVMAGYYPTIALGSDISQQTDQSTLGSSTSVKANQLIYSFAGPLQLYQKAKNVTALSELDQVRQSNLIRLETEKSFLQTWLVQEQERTIKALKKSSESTFQQQKHKNNLGKLDKDTWLKSAEDYATSAVQVGQYQDNLALEYKRLEFFMGEPLSLHSEDNGKTTTTHLTWQYKKKYTLKPLETYHHYALITRPEIPQGLKRMAIEQWNIKIAQGLRLPTISANALAGCNVTPANTVSITPTAIPDAERPSRIGPQINTFWSLGVSFGWTLFDGLVTQYQEQQAQANKTREMLDREQTILRVKQEVHEKYYELIKAVKQLKAQKANYVRNENAFNLMQQKLDLGKISQTDFDGVQTTWQQAQLDWLGRNTAAALAERELIAACGYPKDLD